ALAATAVVTMLATVTFSGLTHPVSSLEGAGRTMGTFFPATYFLTISRGLFSKALELRDLYADYLAMAAFVPVLTLLSVWLLK
ncbi:hypothetical protein OFC37_34270, partial [Escherichia coli]|nr:hypothetical protein [Escherichia coli]